MNAIFQTEPNLAFIVLRLGLAVTFFAHASMHLPGWFGGRGLKGQVTNWKERTTFPFGSEWSGSLRKPSASRRWPWDFSPVRSPWV